jgi:hypothetical protein
MGLAMGRSASVDVWLDPRGATPPDSEVTIGDAQYARCLGIRIELRLRRDTGHAAFATDGDTVALCRSPSKRLQARIASERFRAGCGQIICPIQRECSANEEIGPCDLDDHMKLLMNTDR